MDLSKQFPEILLDLADVATELGINFLHNGKTAVDYLLQMPHKEKKSDDVTAFLLLLETKVHEMLKSTMSDNSSFRQFTTGVDELDKALDGGLRDETITEVFGVSGCGKSHLIASGILANQAATKRGNSKNSLIICTERQLDTTRMKESIHYLPSSGGLSLISYMYCSDIHTFDHVIFTQLPAFLERESRHGKHFDLVAIDSIAHHLRGPDCFLSTISFLKSHLKKQEAQLMLFERYYKLSSSYDAVKEKFYRSAQCYQDSVSRAYYLMSIYNALMRICRRFHLAIILTNQVSEYFTPQLLANEGGLSLHPLEVSFQIGIYSGWGRSLINSWLKGLIGQPNLCCDELETERTSQDENSSTVPLLGSLWSRLVVNRIRLLNCIRDTPGPKKVFARPLSLDVAKNLNTSNPVVLLITGSGLVDEGSKGNDGLLHHVEQP
uniref:RecA family profile 1 domain-containing protein n=1 Tax=Candidozyma auris TaxID=498019 RepID=A0A0L0P0W5_CANAR